MGLRPANTLVQVGEIRRERYVMHPRFDAGVEPAQQPRLLLQDGRIAVQCPEEAWPGGSESINQHLILEAEVIPNPDGLAEPAVGPHYRLDVRRSIVEASKQRIDEIGSALRPFDQSEAHPLRIVVKIEW